MVKKNTSLDLFDLPPVPKRVKEKTTEITAPHTQEKLLLYEEYLKSYLSVMCEVPYWDTIYVWEPFAGKGILDDGSEGSALIAAGIIDKFRNDYPEKDIKLFLNELKSKKFKKLEESMEKYKDFVEVYNYEAEDFIKNMIRVLNNSKNRGKIHNLFFMDPYGYTQYTKENLEELLGLRKIDYLMFFPTKHIYRFLRTKESPAKKFLIRFGISEDTLKTISEPDSLAQKIISTLQKMADTRFAYSYKLKSRGKPNVFHLLFITKNIKGAEKFLEAKRKVKKELKAQLEFFDINTSEMNGDLIKIKNSQNVSGDKLYEELIVKGYHPRDAERAIKQIEKEKKEKEKGWLFDD